MIHNTLYDTWPVILHCPSSEVKHTLWDRALKDMLKYQTHFAPVPNLSIITWNNRSEEGAFEISIRRSGLTCDVLGKGLTPWNNRDKIRLTKEYARNCLTDYILGVDSFDAIILGDPEKTVQALKTSGAGMIFNGSIMAYPPVAAFLEFEENAPQGVFRYLNAGAWVATTPFCREFFEHAHAFPDDENTAPFPRSEQVVLRAIVPRFKGRVKIDDQCEIFQVIEFANLYPPGHENTQYIEFAKIRLLLL